MAKATQSTERKKTVSISIKPKVPSGMVPCNVCDGKGYHKKPSRKK